MKKWFLSVLLVLFSAPAAAAGYASVGYAFSNIEPDDTSSDVDVSALQFNFGTWLNPEGTFGAELRAALGTDDDRLSGGTEVEIDRYYGGYLRGQFPNSLPVRPYGLLGATRVETTHSGGGHNSSENYFDVSLGIGADVDITDQVYASLEYLRVVDHSGEEISNVTLGVGGRF